VSGLSPAGGALRGQVSAGTGAGAPASGYGQVTMVNQTSTTLDLYVGDAYGCRALRNLMCTTQVRPGTHVLEARAGDGRSTSTTTEVGAGDSVTWTITEEE
jgi:hypothetical protein